MKYILLLLAATGAFNFNTVREIQVAAPDANLDRLRVISWNIDRGTELDLIASELERCPADLLLLQEVDLHTARAHDKDVAAELARRLRLNASFATEFEELGQEKERGQAYIGQATLTRLPVHRSRVLRFRHQSGWWEPRAWIPSSIPLMQRRVGSRVALVSELDFHGRLLVVYNAHLESRSAGRIQSEQLDEILADTKRYPPQTAILLGGDLNTKYLPSHFLHKLEAQGFQSAFGQHIESTAAFFALDWIFSRGPIRLDDARVLHQFKGSDHAAVYAEVIAR